MSWGWSWRPYVSVAERRAKAAREMAKMAKKGHAVAPVRIAGRNIATTFWGKGWCENLEAYSDYANRLPRGRTYVRNGSVVDLQIKEGEVTAKVSGSELYTIKITIKPLKKAHWERVQTECAGKIDSLIELLQGRLSSGVMGVVTDRDKGLFPKPAEISLDCSCPDWADMCKHVAATLYGVGARLDEKPELLFLLRGVDPAGLISKVSATEAIRQGDAGAAQPGLSEAELGEVFGIEVESSAVETPAAMPAKGDVPAPKSRSKAAQKKRSKSAAPAPPALVPVVAAPPEAKPGPPRRPVRGTQTARKAKTAK